MGQGPRRTYVRQTATSGDVTNGSSKTRANGVPSARNKRTVLFSPFRTQRRGSQRCIQRSTRAPAYRSGILRNSLFLVSRRQLPVLPLAVHTCPHVHAKHRDESGSFRQYACTVSWLRIWVASGLSHTEFQARADPAPPAAGAIMAGRTPTVAAA